MTAEEIGIGIFILIGIVLIIVGIAGFMLGWLILPFAIFFVIGGIAVIIITIIISFIML